MEMESNHRTRRNGFTVRRVWPLRYPCVLMHRTIPSTADKVVDAPTYRSSLGTPKPILSSRVRTERDSNPRTIFTASGFQDRCFQPLNHLSMFPMGTSTHLPILILHRYFLTRKRNVFDVCILRERDSNPQPSAYETDELTIATISHEIGCAGFEPTTLCL